jgi:hypothetical protein
MHEENCAYRQDSTLPAAITALYMKAILRRRALQMEPSD